MAVERRNPVPKGRYWVSIVDTPKYPSARSLFKSYLSDHADTIGVVGKTTQDNLDWYLFDIRSPTRWAFTSAFLPAIVRSPENPNAPVVNTIDDVVLRPEPPKPFGEQVQDILSDAKTILILAGLWWAFSQSGKR